MNTNWESVGAIAELTGSVGVILTLIYVALQVKHANLGMLVAARQEQTRQYNEFVDLLINDAELSALYIAGSNGESLDQIERFRYFAINEKSTWQFSSMFYQQCQQPLAEEEWHQVKTLISRTCTRPGYRKWWSVNRHAFEQNFANLIDELQSEAAG